MKYTSFIFLLLLGCVPLFGCAPPGYHYEPFSVVPTPNDVCMRPLWSSASAIRILNEQREKPFDLSSPVTKIEDLHTPPHVIQSDTRIVCHGTKVTQDGLKESGYLEAYENGSIVTIKWKSDKQMAEEEEKREEARNKIENIPTATLGLQNRRIFDDLKKKFDENPDGIVKFGLADNPVIHYYTTNSICYEIVKFTTKNYPLLVPDPATTLLEGCSRPSTDISSLEPSGCLTMLHEMEKIGDMPDRNLIPVMDKQVLVDKCSHDLARETGHSANYLYEPCEYFVQIFR